MQCQGVSDEVYCVVLQVKVLKYLPHAHLCKVQVLPRALVICIKAIHHIEKLSALLLFKEAHETRHHQVILGGWDTLNDLHLVVRGTQ